MDAVEKVGKEGLVANTLLTYGAEYTSSFAGEDATEVRIVVLGVFAHDITEPSVVKNLVA